MFINVNVIEVMADLERKGPQALGCHQQLDHHGLERQSADPSDNLCHFSLLFRHEVEQLITTLVHGV